MCSPFFSTGLGIEENPIELAQSLPLAPQRISPAPESPHASPGDNRSLADLADCEPFPQLAIAWRIRVLG